MPLDSARKAAHLQAVVTRSYIGRTKTVVFGECAGLSDIDLHRGKTREAYHHQATHAGACYSYSDYSEDRISRYSRYHYSHHAREVQRGQHATSHLDSYCTNSIYHVASSSDRIVVEQCGYQWPNDSTLYDYAGPDEQSFFHKVSDDTPWKKQKAYHDERTDSFYYTQKQDTYEHHTRDGVLGQSILYECDTIPYFFGFLLAYVRDAKLYDEVRQYPYFSNNTVCFSLSLHPYYPDTPSFASQSDIAYTKPYQEESYQERKNIYRNDIASEVHHQIEYQSWQSSNLCRRPPDVCSIVGASSYQNYLISIPQISSTNNSTSLEMLHTIKEVKYAA